MSRRKSFICFIIIVLMASTAGRKGITPASADSTPPGGLSGLEEYWYSLYPGLAIDEPFSTLDRTLLTKASPDECYNGIGELYLPGQTCVSGAPKVNEGYVFGLAKAGNDLWIGTVSNMPCLVISQLLGIIPPHETTAWVCEFGQSDFGKQAFPENPVYQNLLGDWRPPHIYLYNLESGQRVDKTPTDSEGAFLIEQTIGLRAAGTLEDVVILAGPTLAAWTGIPINGYLDGMNFFAYSTDGTYLGSKNIPEFSDIRKWLVVDGVLYTSIRNTSQGDGSVLRWTGSKDNPFQFEVVGHLDNEGADLAFHEGRIFVSTWPDLNPQKVISNQVPAGLYMSPLIPEGGLTSEHIHGWQKVWAATDYEPDMLTALTYLGGGLHSFDGYLYWGSMHFPVLAAAVHLFAVYGGIPDEIPYEELLGTVIATHRPTNIFRGRNFGTPDEDKQVVYGLPYMPAQQLDGQFALVPNKMGTPVYGLAGFGNFYNTYTWTMSVYQGQLFVGTFDWSYVFREALEVILYAMTGSIPQVSIQLPLPGYGADLFRFPSSQSYAVPESISGVGNYTNYGIRTMLADDALYLGTANPMNLLTDPTDLIPEGGWELISLSGVPGELPEGEGNLVTAVKLQVPNACQPDQGELIELTGKLHTRYLYEWDKNGQLHLKLHTNTQKLRGVGITSGMNYVANGVTNIRAKIGSLPAEVNYISHFNLIQQGSGDNLHGHILLRMTVNKLGLPAAQILNINIDCK
jgi:hypothetical protein